MSFRLPFLLLLFFAFASEVLNAQDVDWDILGPQLVEKANKSHGKERLLWLDSLTTNVWRNPKFNYDSLAIETIALSIELDTLDLGAYHIVNRIYQAARTKGTDQAKRLFDDFKDNYIGRVTKSRRLANFYKAGGLLHYNMDLFSESLTYYRQALEPALKTADNQAIGEIYMGFGMVNYSLGKLLESSKALQESIPYFEKSGSVNAMINVKNVMTSLYSENGFYQEAAAERAEALEMAIKANHHLFLSQIYFNHSVELQKRKKYQERIPLLEKALAAIDSSRYKSYYKPIYLGGMVTAQCQLGQLENAKAYMRQLEEEPRKNDAGEAAAFYKEAQMRLAFAQQNYAKALSLGKQYLKYKYSVNQSEGLEVAQLFLSEVYKKLGNYKQADYHAEAYHRLKDSIKSVQNVNGLAYYQTLYETEKRDATIAQQEGEITLLDTRNRVKNQWIIFGGLGLLLLFGSFIALRSRHFAKRKQQIQKEFAQHVILAQEKERKFIAKELHDGLGQELLLIKNTSEISPERVPAMVDKTIDEIRALSRNLHPVGLEKFGLTKAIENMINEVNNATNIFFSDDLDNIDELVSKDRSIYIYRIIQECINNIIKHSEATASKVSIEDKSDYIKLTVQDNGKGFELDSGKQKLNSFGLRSLVERVDFLKGKIEFEAIPKKGTTVIITLFKE